MKERECYLVSLTTCTTKNNNPERKMPRNRRGKEREEGTKVRKQIFKRDAYPSEGGERMEKKGNPWAAVTVISNILNNTDHFCFALERKKDDHEEEKFIYKFVVEMKNWTIERERRKKMGEKN